jgi:hypothetical protein
MLHAAKQGWQVFATSRDARYRNKPAVLANNWQEQLMRKRATLPECRSMQQS